MQVGLPGAQKEIKWDLTPFICWAFSKQRTLPSFSQQILPKEALGLLLPPTLSTTGSQVMMICAEHKMLLVQFLFRNGGKSSFFILVRTFLPLLFVPNYFTAKEQLNKETAQQISGFGHPNFCAGSQYGKEV